jgi:DNA-binding IclR family transcriptional regulator
MADQIDSGRKTIDKAMQILMEFVHDRHELAVSDLAERLNMHKSVVSRLVSSLREWGMLEKNQSTGRLRIGPTAFRIGTLYSQRTVLSELSMPMLAELVRVTGHSAHLSVLDGLHILVIATIESPNALRVIMRIGDQRYLHTTAAGKLFLALSPPDLFEAASTATHFKALTPQTITGREELLRSFTRIRRERIASNGGENTPGAGAIAAPVMNSAGVALAAVSTVFPLNVVDRQTRTLIEVETARCAEALADKYGQLYVHRKF